mmetsp:Transcript_17847/g.49509  ORF Transcript_17847/g.49509 Transcript_17847/m.49509 type:complete len:280 (-) Transcript_17847:16-855(-)
MAADTPAAPAYDGENIFAKILDKKVPCFKIYESRTTLAFLDAYPMVEGHTIVVPKLKGHVDLLSMPPAKAADFLSEVQKVAKAVQKAFDAEGVNIWQNNGAAAGQTVFHPHFHIVPRKAGTLDGFSYPASAKEMLSADAAKPLMAKLEEALWPKAPLRKAKFNKVSSIKPNSKGMNLKLKVLADVEVVEAKFGRFYEVLCGDDTGTVVISLREELKNVVKKDAIIAMRNAAVKMVAGHVRMAVDKWGKVEACDEEMEGEVDMATEKNLSATEYELVASA